MKKNFTNNFIDEAKNALSLLDIKKIDSMAKILSIIRKDRGRVFFLGVGGSGANCSHAVNDFRKLCDIECYCPSDNVSELTARVNDDGWDTSYLNWLKVSKFSKNDALFVFSVGGGDLKKNISANLVKCVEEAKKIGSKVMGIVGKDGGYSKEVSDLVLLIPVVDEKLITPHTEGWQAVVWHLLVSHPKIAVNEMKWESV